MGKNILHVVNIYFALSYFIGGQFKHFKSKGYNMNVACSPSPFLAEYSQNNGFDYIETPVNRSISLKDDLKTIKALGKFIKKKEIDIVVGHTPKGALLAMIAGWINRVPKRIYVRHGLVYETSKGLKRFMLKNVDRIASLCATDIVCVSQSVLERSIFDKLAPASKQLIWGEGTCNGIDTVGQYNPENIKRDELNELKAKYGISESDYIIGFSGRLVRDKGISELVDAFEMLPKSQNYKLLLVGMFEERDSLTDITKQRILNNPNIIYTGFINGGMEKYYALMDMYVLPSYREGFPIGILEAQSMGLPVITTTVTGCRDSIIDGVTGLFISHSPQDIAQKINIIRFDKAINGQEGRRWVKEHFDNHIVWKEIEKLYQ